MTLKSVFTLWAGIWVFCIAIASVAQESPKPSDLSMTMVVQQGHSFVNFELSADDRYLMTREEGGNTLNVWDLESDSILMVINNGSSSRSLMPSPDFTRFLSHSHNCNFIAINRTAPNNRQTKFQPYFCYNRGISHFLSDNKRVVFSTKDRDGFEIWDVDLGKRTDRIKTPCSKGGSNSAKLTDMTKTEDGILTYCYRDGEFAFWDLEAQKRVWTMNVEGYRYDHAAFLADQKTIGYAAHYYQKPPKGSSYKVPSKLRAAFFTFDKRNGNLISKHVLPAEPKLFFPIFDSNRVLLIVRKMVKKYNGKKGRYRDYKRLYHYEPFILNTQTGRLKKVGQGKIKLHSQGSVALTRDGKSFWAIDNSDSAAKKWDIETGRVLKKLNNKEFRSNYALVADSSSFAITNASRDGNIYTWDGFGLSLKGEVSANADLQEAKYYQNKISLSENHKAAFGFSGSKDNSYPHWYSDLRFWQNSNNELVLKRKHHTRHSVKSVAFSKAGDMVAIRGHHGRPPETIELWDAINGTFIRSLDPYQMSGFRLGRSYQYSTGMDFSPSGRYLLVGAREIGVFDLETNRIVSKFCSRYKDADIALAFLPDEEHVVIANGTVELWNWKQRKRIRYFGERRSKDRERGTIDFAPPDQLAVSSDGQRIVTNYLIYGIDVFDTSSGKRLQRLQGHSNKINSIDFLPGDRHVVTSSKDGTMRIWSLDTGHSAALMVYNDQWVVFTDDGYFDASPRSGDIIRVTLGFKSYRVDQFALRNNRPDIILKRLRLGTPKLIEHYQSLYKRRLREFNVTEQQVDSLLVNAPKAKIRRIEQKGKWARLFFEVSDKTSELRQYNVYVNDVPLMGAYGKKISGRHQTLEATVELTGGSNKIEISARNELGVESLRDHRIVDCPIQKMGSLYYLGFGVSEYDDTSLNLKYAAKDVTDLEAVFRKGKRNYTDVHTKVFTNSAVTKEAIKAAKTFFKTATVDDTVVIFVAGHGLYDPKNNEDYYYLTHDADLNKLATTAARFELIEELLQGIGPRKKILLIDTCQSGEFEGKQEDQYMALAAQGALISRGIRKTVLNNKKTDKVFKRLNVDRQRYIYNDLYRRSGAIVLSSSRGSEWSYERDDLQNGVFTQEVINALTQDVADLDQNQLISTEELRNYVTEAVPRATLGLQHPVVDRDNIEMVFSLPVVKYNQD